MTRYEEIKQVAAAFVKRSDERTDAARKFADGALYGFAKYTEAPNGSLFYLPWNDRTKQFDPYDPSRQVPVWESVHLDEETNRWQFSFFIRLNPGRPDPAEGVTIMVNFSEHKNGYYVAMGDGRPLLVHLEAQPEREALWQFWVDSAKGMYAERPEEMDFTPQVWAG